jgi:tetratricopeptide (TPR) repeat protein
MKTAFSILAAAAFLLAGTLSVSAQQDLNRVEKSKEGLYFMFYDSSNSKSTIVEFSDFVVLIEVPVKDEGGGATNMKDHIEGGLKAIRTIEKEFPGKPIKYVIHSHWHPHSISAVAPFLENGSKLITTMENYSIIKKYVDETVKEKYKSNVIFAEADPRSAGDSLVIDEPGNRIVIHYLKKSDYPNLPTVDYLYCYLPNYNMLHCACMYNKWTGEPVEGKEMLTGREEDLHRFLAEKNIKPEHLIRLTNEKSVPGNLQPFSGLDDVVNNGIRASDILNRYTMLSEQELKDKFDVITEEIINNNIPVSLMNTAAYQMLRSNDLGRALVFAKLQAFLNPSDPNSWDTLGEVYYFMGKLESARKCSREAKEIDPNFSQGGEKVWEEDLKEYQKIWESAK